MTPQQDYRWRIEVRASTVPHDEWVELRDATNGVGRRYRFIERDEAEAVLRERRRIQPLAVLRIVAV